MRLSLYLSSIAISLSLTACVSIELDSNTKDSISKQLTTQLSQLNTVVDVTNIVQVTQNKTVIKNADYIELTLRTADQKIYKGSIPVNLLSNQQLNQLSTLKSATLVGVMTTQTANQFNFVKIKNMKN